MGLVDSFFPNFRNSVFAIFTSIKDFIYEHFVKYFQGVIDWFKSQYESIVGKVQEATQATVAPPESPAIVPEASIAPTKQAKAVTQRKSLDLGVSQKEKAITGSGAQVKNITINIQKLVEKIENRFESTSKYDDAKMKEAITQSLISAVNDFNQL